jgi:sec-independent protein translocase protein TatB
LRREGRRCCTHETIDLSFYAGSVFNLSGSEVVFLLIAGLVVLGPERLPGVIRKVGQIYGDLRRATQGFEKDFRDTFKEPLNEITNTTQKLRAGFGEIDTEPSPPMRPERAVVLPEAENDDSAPIIEEP